MAKIEKFNVIWHQFHSIRVTIVDAIVWIWSMNFVRWIVGGTLFINVIIWLIAFLEFRRIPYNQVVLHYNVDYGVDYLGETNKIFFVPLIGIIIILVNLVVIGICQRQEKFIHYVALYGALVANIVLLIAQGLLYRFNLR